MEAGAESLDETQPIRYGARVVWVSPSYGYSGKLMYFGDIFQKFTVRFPLTWIPVAPEGLDSEVAGVNLLPILRLRYLSWQRQVGEASYAARMALPSPATLLALFRLKPDVIITIEFTPLALAALLMASLSSRIARVQLVESDPEARGGSRIWAVLAIKRWACRRADVIVSNNEAGRRFAVEDLRAASAKVLVAPYLTSHPPGPLPDLSAAPRGIVRLLFVNSLTERKGLSHLLASLALLSEEQRRKLRLTVVGDGPQRTRLEAQTIELGLAKQVEFVGAKPYRCVGAFYAKADVLVAPSLADYRSLASFEGLAYGLALLVSSFDGAAAETVVEGVTGYSVAPHDHAKLASSIAGLIENPQRLAAMRKASLAFFTERFSVDRVVANLESSVLLALNKRMEGRK